MTFEIPGLAAGLVHTIVAEKLGSFYDPSVPVVVTVLESATLQQRIPNVRQGNTGISLSFDSTFTGGKAKVLT